MFGRTCGSPDLYFQTQSIVGLEVFQTDLFSSGVSVKIFPHERVRGELHGSRRRRGELHTGGRRKVIPQVVWFFSVRFKEAAARTERDGQSALLSTEECGGPSGTSTLL